MFCAMKTFNSNLFYMHDVHLQSHLCLEWIFCALLGWQRALLEQKQRRKRQEPLMVQPNTEARPRRSRTRRGEEQAPLVESQLSIVNDVIMDGTWNARHCFRSCTVTELMMVCELWLQVSTALQPSWGQRPLIWEQKSKSCRWVRPNTSPSLRSSPSLSHPLLRILSEMTTLRHC